jgi:putative zinc finger protein
MIRQVIPGAMKINCKEASRLISQSMDERLSFGQRLRLRLHLLLCDACRNFKSNMQLLRRGVARLLQK